MELNMANHTMVTRRHFLKTAAASMAVPYVITTSVLGAGKNTAPSDRINMGFIGLGGQGSGHLLGGAWTYVPGGYIARQDVQVQAVCDVQQARRMPVVKRCNEIYAERLGKPNYNGVKAYNDFRELLARPDIDAVLIAVPYHWAATLAIMAMRAGKDVYCEKPVAITVRQAQTIVETAKRHGRIYQAGTQQRAEYDGKFRWACELVRNERIGPLKEVYAYRLPGTLAINPWTSDKSIPVPAGLDWDMWLGPLPWRPFAGELGHALSGMFIGDVNWSPHHYDIIQWTVNPDESAPINIEYDKGQIHYHYSNGAVVHSTGYPGEAVGPEGGACFVGPKGRIAVDRSNIVSYPASILKEPMLPNDERVYYATSHSGNFLDCIRSRRATICNPEVAAYTIDVILAGGTSLALQRNLRWEPAKLQFTKDDQANRMLSYTPRSPWRL